MVFVKYGTFCRLKFLRLVGFSHGNTHGPAIRAIPTKTDKNQQQQQQPKATNMEIELYCMSETSMYVHVVGLRHPKVHLATT